MICGHRIHPRGEWLCRSVLYCCWLRNGYCRTLGWKFLSDFKKEHQTWPTTLHDLMTGGEGHHQAMSTGIKKEEDIVWRPWYKQFFGLWTWQGVSCTLQPLQCCNFEEIFEVLCASKEWDTQTHNSKKPRHIEKLWVIRLWVPFKLENNFQLIKDYP